MYGGGELGISLSVKLRYRLIVLCSGLFDMKSETCATWRSDGVSCGRIRGRFAEMPRLLIAKRSNHSRCVAFPLQFSRPCLLCISAMKTICHFLFEDRCVISALGI